MTSENDIREKTRAVVLAALMVMSVVAMTATFSGAAVAANFDGVDSGDYDESVDEDQTINGQTYYEGQVVAVDLFNTAVSDGDTVEIRSVTDTDDNGNPLTTSRAGVTTVEEDDSNDEYILIRTSQIGTGSFTLQESGGNYLNTGTDGDFDATTNSNAERRDIAEFEVIEDSIDFTFDSDSARVGDDEGIDLEYEGARSPVRVTIEEADQKLDRAQLLDMFQNGTHNRVIHGNGDIFVEPDAAPYPQEDNLTLRMETTYFDETVAFNDTMGTSFNADDYSFVAEVEDTNAEDTFDFTLNEEVTGEANFVAPQYNVATGDNAAISIEVDGEPEQVYLSVGDEDDYGYESNVTIEPNEENMTIPLFLTSTTADDRVWNDGNSFTNGPNADGFLTLAETDPDTETDDEVVGVYSSGNLENVLQPGQYDMEVGVDIEGESGVVEDFSDLEEDDVATLNVQERSTNDLNVWTVPDDANWGDAITQDGQYGSENISPYVEDGNLTQSDQIAVTDEERLDNLRNANGDWISTQVDVSGVYSALAHYDTGAGGGTVSTAWEIENGAWSQPSVSIPGGIPDDVQSNDITLQNNALKFNITQVDPDPNKSPYVLNASAKDNFDVTRDDGNTDLYLTADSDDVWFDREDVYNSERDGNAPTGTNIDMTNEVKNASELVGEEFEVSFNVTDEYLATFTRDNVDDEDEVVVDTFEFVDRELTWDNVDSDGVLRVPAEDNATVTGSTTVAPGTEITVRARGSGDDPFLETKDVNVTDNRTFEVNFPFADRTQGQNFTLEVRNQGFDEDAELDAQIGDAPVPATFNVADLSPEMAEVEPGASVDVSATVSNDGEQEGTQMVELSLDGEVLDSEELTLGAGDSQTVEFTGVAAPEEEGDYEHSIASNDSEATGTLTVAAAAPADFQVSGLEPAEATAAPGDSVDVSATVSNAGDEEATKTVEIRLDGETVDSEDVTLAGGEEASVSFSATAPDEAGDYTHSVWTEDSEAEGTLTVEAEEPADDEAADDEAADGNETADDEAADGEGPGFGVVVALLAFLGAALLAARRQVE